MSWGNQWFYFNFLWFWKTLDHSSFNVLEWIRSRLCCFEYNLVCMLYKRQKFIDWTMGISHRVLVVEWKCHFWKIFWFGVLLKLVKVVGNHKKNTFQLKFCVPTQTLVPFYKCQTTLDAKILLCIKTKCCENHFI